ncbi:MAG TPA: hypothetical protein VFC29_25885 [Candidatus Limnocylindrales bacterium]|jgi:hypothetical protein|nr:hypothetical protein [Candidatus Limnocylindrales bacterium]
MERMDYHANIDAALFFAKKIWPLVPARRGLYAGQVEIGATCLGAS